MEGTRSIVDVTTIEAAKQGDQEALVELWRTYQPQVLRFLRSVNASAPEDVASQVWIDVGRTIDRFVGDGVSFQKWIFTIARNRNLDEARRVSRRREVPDDRPWDQRQADDQIEGVGSLEEAIAIVRRLPTDMAEAVMLRVVYDLPVGDVARIMTVSEGNVRVLVHRGLQRLNDMLSKTDPAPGPRRLKSQSAL